ncbi:DUF7344 domain-containing protein [Halorussus amylolyticus]|uniref:DUF7344 domain-containing protein n=1 Tax=Halorussus amylolyticus TaxID=1126242 RepID=UPI0010460057|nr:transcriptional regulator [Halorussus amylolyticus]
MNDKSFDALRNEHRRELLLALLEHNPQTVTKPIPAGGEVAPADADRQFQTAMYHQHLPKLEEYGFIGWDRDSHEIVKGPQFDDIRPLLGCIHDHTER